MAYDLTLAERVRNYLEKHKVETIEKKMFGGLAFLVNDKMCINVSKDRLMCRFNPKQTEAFSKKKGYEPMIMRGKLMNGYCYVQPEGYDFDTDFEFWMHTCLIYNEEQFLNR